MQVRIQLLLRSGPTRVSTRLLVLRVDQVPLHCGCSRRALDPAAELWTRTL